MRSAGTKYGVVGLVVLILAAYVVAVGMYAQSGTGRRLDATAATPDGDKPSATINVEDIQSNNSVLAVNLAFNPGSALLDPTTHHLKDDLSLRVRSAAMPARHTWTKGMLPGLMAVPLTIAGQIERWPFDQYRSGPIEVEIFYGPDTERAAVRVPVTFVDHLSGWRLSATRSQADGPYRLNVRRSLSTAAFAIVILGVLITIASLAVFVAVQTARDRRPFQPPMTTWYAAMLFAVVPLRNALPGSPPFGSWVDITVVIWVLAALALSMVIYISTWWRHLKPMPAVAPANPAPAPADPAPAPAK
ncbi:DUF4436 domain-containing protein [Mycobacterium mantenii]|uniref:DUF4436 domain-containing protein n=1 Tax=Mycobacterium mantenii TaxID=560555 RepID=A0A1A2TFX9_MYCNT|nr:DUF4436 domain-containing protein [Mycobacterium mantenii]OBH44665.1 DUF4436 domain-containing protein [Mycobacterium mantenii]OBH60556.1 DUF4436 domain-containing protein [Mycobacterium mantenii]OBH74942.1 DUF4436 domain-containing protein [Mycobacterium mantenii]OBH77299.1 DUF4436 domain-containing protein [Mycobacterium mantenii]